MLQLAIKPIEYVDGDTRRMAEVRATSRALIALGLSGGLSHTPDGAPYIPGRDDIVVSVSHSRTTAVVAVSDSPLGIDIESPRAQLRRVASRFMSAAELSASEAIDDGLLRAWTAKEAVFKAARATGVDFASDIVLALPDFRSATFVPGAKTFDIEYRPQPGGELLAIATLSSPTQ